VEAIGKNSSGSSPRQAPRDIHAVDRPAGSDGVAGLRGGRAATALPLRDSCKQDSGILGNSWPFRRGLIRRSPERSLMLARPARRGRGNGQFALIPFPGLRSAAAATVALSHNAVNDGINYRQAHRRRIAWRCSGPRQLHRRSCGTARIRIFFMPEMAGEAYAAAQKSLCRGDSRALPAADESCAF
jgi:hypothetical protein